MPIIDTKKNERETTGTKKMYQNKLRAKLVQLNKHTGNSIGPIRVSFWCCLKCLKMEHNKINQIKLKRSIRPVWGTPGNQREY